MARYGPIMIAITVSIALLYILTTLNYQSSTTTTTLATAADYMVLPSTFESDYCQCLLSNNTMQNKKKAIKNTMIYGENAPVLVPETLPNIPSEIKDKLQLNKVDNTVLVTVAGYDMRYHVYNWISKLNEIEETKFVVFCTDYKLYVHLIVTGYEAQAVFISETSPVKVLQRLVYTDDHVLYMMVDVDALFVRSRGKEYLTTLMNIRHETHLMATHDGQHNMNAGVLMARGNSKHVKRLLANAIQENDDLNQALSKMQLHVKSGMYVLLDILHFPNGDCYFEKDLSRSKGIQPYIIHANNKDGEEKIEMLKEHGLWAVNEDWVDSHNIQVEAILNRSGVQN